MDLTYLGVRAILKLIFQSQTNKMLIDYQGGENAIYIGMAKPGSNTRSKRWQIKMMTYDTNNNMTALRFAGGSLSFNYRWIQRVAYNYS